MKLGRPGIAMVTLALGLAIPLGTGANATTLVVQSTATISGTVTGGGLAIVGACVSVEGSGQPISTTTNGSGHYVLPGVVPDVSTFGLRVDPSCSTDAHAVDYLFFYDAISVPSAAPQTIDVALVLGGSASGSVVDAAHHPIANVCISIMTPDHQSYGFTQSRSDGTFTVAGVTPGTYIATLDGCYGAQQGPTRDIQPQFYDNTQNQLNAVPIVVQLGVTTVLQQQTMLDAGEINLTLTPPAGVSPDELLIEMLPPANAPQGLELRGNIIGFDAQGNAQIRNLLPIGYTIGYEYCPSSQPCRPDVGFYKNQGIDNPVPTIVTPTPGVLQTLTDSMVIPPYAGSTVTLTTTPAPHVAGSVVAITATVVPTSGSHVPVGTVDFSDTTSQAEAPGNINGQATIDAQGRATLFASNVAAGLHTIVAGYRGDGGTSQSMSQPLSFTVDPASTGGGGGGGSAPASGIVIPGGTLTSDPAGTTPDASNPLVVGVTSPVGGAVTIDKTPPNTPIGHYSVLGVGATITAPTATPGDPLHLTFQVFDGTLPAGSHPSDITIFRDGVAVLACTGAGATPDPCVASVTTNGGVTTFDVRSSHASTWDVEAARVGRVAGPDRIATAVAVSQDSFPNGHAGAVVLARADDYPDALGWWPVGRGQERAAALDARGCNSRPQRRPNCRGSCLLVARCTCSVARPPSRPVSRRSSPHWATRSCDTPVPTAIRRRRLLLRHSEIRPRYCSRPERTFLMRWRPDQQPRTCTARSC